MDTDPITCYSDQWKKFALISHPLCIVHEFCRLHVPIKYSAHKRLWMAASLFVLFQINNNSNTRTDFLCVCQFVVIRDMHNVRTILYYIIYYYT